MSAPDWVHRPQPQVLVTIGTDHHPFVRLWRWVEAIAPQLGCTWLIQHGHSPPPPRVGDAVDFLDSNELAIQMANSRAVITHGGPASIAEARAVGHHPICVPRDPEHGEHVDGHQLSFARHLAGQGLLRLVENEAELLVAVHDQLARERGTPAGRLGVVEGADELGRVVLEAAASRPLRRDAVARYLRARRVPVTARPPDSR